MYFTSALSYLLRLTQFLKRYSPIKRVTLVNIIFTASSFPIKSVKTFFNIRESVVKCGFLFFKGFNNVWQSFVLIIRYSLCFPLKLRCSTLWYWWYNFRWMHWGIIGIWLKLRCARLCNMTWLLLLWLFTSCIFGNQIDDWFSLGVMCWWCRVLCIVHKSAFLTIATAFNFLKRNWYDLIFNAWIIWLT